MAVFLAILKNLYVNLALNGNIFDNIRCIFASGQKKVDVKMPVLGEFMTANSILHPTLAF